MAVNEKEITGPALLQALGRLLENIREDALFNEPSVYEGMIDNAVKAIDEELALIPEQPRPSQHAEVFDTKLKQLIDNVNPGSIPGGEGFLNEVAEAYENAKRCQHQ